MRSLVALFAVLVVGYCFWNVYMCFVRPHRWAELFIIPRRRWWGLSVSGLDEKKLEREARMMGIIFLVTGLFFAWSFTLPVK